MKALARIFIICGLLVTTPAISSPEKNAEELGQKIVGTWAVQGVGKKCEKKDQKTFSSYGDELPCTFTGKVTFTKDLKFSCDGDFEGGLSCKDVEPTSWATKVSKVDFGVITFQFKNTKSGTWTAIDWAVKSIGAKKAEVRLPSYNVTLEKS